MPPKSSVPSRVVVHPIVLLSVVDHFNRLSRIGNQRRVVGVLLGSWRKGNVVDIATSFAGNSCNGDVVVWCGVSFV
jgi:26S proteasome regulatory subunit N8